MHKTIVFLIFFLLTKNTFAQDTIRLNKKPKVIIKSWYPEFKEFPDLKIGDSKILFIVLYDYKNKSILNNTDIDLLSSSNKIEIEETDKPNQYLVTLNSTSEKFIDFDLWLDPSYKNILIKDNGKWIDICDLYDTKNDRILIDRIRLDIRK